MNTNRRTFLRILATSGLAAATLPLLTQCGGATRNDLTQDNVPEDLQLLLGKDKMEILRLASLAPNGHNTQPWTVKILAPHQWRIGTDPTRWLPAVDPGNRELMLSIGAFIENLCIAASHFGYAVEMQVVADSPRSEIIANLTLHNTTPREMNLSRLTSRCTIRKGILPKELATNDVQALTADDSRIVYFSPSSSQGKQLAEATFEANRLQVNRESAQEELADWIRWSDDDVRKHRDGITPATMEITGFAGWYVRHFYSRKQVLQQGFKDATLKQVAEQVKTYGGWFVVTDGQNQPANVDAVSAASPQVNVVELLETGRRFERLFLNVRERNIALHPMTQLLEESSSFGNWEAQLGVPGNIQFLLRTGYVTSYPDPVSVRRPVAWFTQV